MGTHLDGEIHFYTPGKDIASLDMDYLVHEGVIVAFVEEEHYDELTKTKAQSVLTKYGDIAGAENPGLHKKM